MWHFQTKNGVSNTKSINGNSLIEVCRSQKNFSTISVGFFNIFARLWPHDEAQRLDYLKDFVTATRSGTCIVCDKKVSWSTRDLSRHKRANCVGLTVQEKLLFAIPIATTSSDLNQSDASMHSQSASENDSTIPGVPPSKEEIDEALAKLFFRTGMSFRILDSAPFRDFVELLNPEYAKEMPKSRSLSGVHLELQWALQPLQARPNSASKGTEALGFYSERRSWTILHPHTEVRIRRNFLRLEKSGHVLHWKLCKNQRPNDCQRSNVPDDRVRKWRFELDWWRETLDP